MQGLKKIKHYKIVEVLGTGGMGMVYRALDTVLEREVAIKVMHRHLCNDEVTRKRFMQEARVAANLVHPNIVGIYEIGVVDDGPYIVMEYVAGKTLLQFFEDQPEVDSKLAIKFVLQILTALSFAHMNKTWHRDIKPDNILVAEDENVKILDFGIAKILTQKGLTEAGDILGTAEYMAPEQMLGEESDHRSDIYATGIMLYQLLTQRMPFEGDNPVEVLYKKINEDPVPPSYYNHHIGQELNHILVKAISKDITERWEDAGEFALALEALKSADLEKKASPARQADLTEFYLDIPSTAAAGIQAELKAAFVGRSKEINRLRERLRQISSGQGFTVIIKGEAGVGKSTLAREFEKSAVKDQAWVLYGVCLYQQGLNAYLPFWDALRRFLNQKNEDIDASQVSDLKKRIATEVPVIAEFIELASESSKAMSSSANTHLSPEKLFDAWCQVVALFASIQPLVLIIDDLHLADEASLRLFHYLSHHVSNKNLLLMGISRVERYDLQKEGKPTMAAEMLTRIGRESNIEQITIYRLSKESCGALIDRTLSPSLFTEEFYERIYSETKGNPLFVLETLKLLRSKEMIFQKDGVWYNVQEGLDIYVPSKVEDIFVQRLGALSEEEREILQFGSVVGYKFEASQLSRLLDMPKIRLLKTLQRIETGLQIIASQEVDFYFEHPMSRDLLYNDIPLQLRQEYHAMVASDMQEVFQGDYGDKIGEVALHLRNAGKYSKAVPLLYQASQRSFAHGLYRDTILLIQDYMETLQESGTSEPNSIMQMDLYFKLGKCYEQTIRLEESLSAYEKLLNLSGNKKEATAKVEALTCLGRVQIKLGEYQSALETYNECIELAEDNRLSNAAGKAYNNLGALYFSKGELEKAQHFFGKSIEAKQGEESEYGKAFTLMNLGIIADMRYQFEYGLELYTEALGIFTEQGSQEDQARAYMNMGITYGHQGDWLHAIETYEKGVELIEKGQDEELKGLLYINLGRGYVSLDNYQEAKLFAKKALKIFKLMGDSRKVGDAYQVFGLLYGMQGNLYQAELFLNESLKMYDGDQHRDSIAEAYESFAKIYLANNDIKRSEEYYNKAAEAYRELNLQARVVEIEETVKHLPSEDEPITV